MTDEHRAVDYRGRTVCSCGDFNCASLDAGRNWLTDEFARASARLATLPEFARPTQVRFTRGDE